MRMTISKTAMHHNRHHRHRAGGSATSARPLPDSPFRPGDSVIYYGAAVRVQRINNGTVTVYSPLEKKAFSVHPSLLQAAGNAD